MQEFPSLQTAAVILSGLLANPDNSPAEDQSDQKKALHRDFCVAESVRLAVQLNDVYNRSLQKFLEDNAAADDVEDEEEAP